MKGPEPLRLAVVALPILLAGTGLHAQYFRKSNYWKTQRNEISVGLGASNFLGELGGRDQIGTNFVWDLELSQTRPAVSLGWRYYLRERMSLRTSLAYGVLAGNDNLTKEPFRQNRNLNFRSDVFEFSVVYELHSIKEELGHIYDLRGVKGMKASRMGLYGFIGLGGFYFDPRGKFNNAWIRLKPLRTEGQGLPGGAQEYSNFGFCVPMGFGIRKAFSKEWSLGLEIQHTTTFTDYVDDVSTVYYDPEAIQQVSGDVGVYMANPSLGVGEGISEFTTSPGQQRGDSSDNDAYLFLRFQVHYKIHKNKSGSKRYRTRIRRQKIIF